MGKSCVVTVVQAEVAPDREDGLARTAQLAHAAARSGVELIVFPERGLSSPREVRRRPWLVLTATRHGRAMVPYETATCHMDEQPRYRT